MERASFDGSMVTVAGLAALAGAEWERSGLRPLCPVCLAEVHPYGMLTPQGVQRFDHPDARPDTDAPGACGLARRGGRYRALEVQDVDLAAGRLLRDAFVRTGRLVDAYRFLVALTSGCCSPAQFDCLLRAADARGIWCYVEMRPWAVPFVLACLDDFRTPQGVGFRFVMGRTRRRGGPRPWSGMAAGVVTKHFVDTGLPFERGDLRSVAVTREEHDRILSLCRTPAVSAARAIGAARAAFLSRTSR